MVAPAVVHPDCIKETKRVLRERLCKGEAPSIHGYVKERRELFELVKRTATLGESNSLLLVGPRGSGKTMLLKDVLKELKQLAEVKNNLLEVHLNGLMQTDDRLALREITRQLQLENSVGDRVFGSFSENLQFLLEALKSGGQQSKSILFVLDEFDLFAAHRNQTLLYNLFDVSQSAQAPICVLGLTTRLDVLEILEKRVKSRFSHRQLHVFPAWRFADLLELFRLYLSLPPSFPDAAFAAKWNESVQDLSTNGTVCDILKRHFSLSKDVRALCKLLLLPVCSISADRPFLQPTDFQDSNKLLSADSKANMLHGVSVLELCLIIAMSHLTETYQGEPFNFEMVYNEYQKFCQRRSAGQLFDKAVVLKAFEHLCALELVRPSGGEAARTLKEFRSMTLLVDADQLKQALQKYPQCPTEVRQWANSGTLTLS